MESESTGRISVTGWLPEREAPGARHGVIPMTHSRHDSFRPVNPFGREVAAELLALPQAA
jgi:hypothetical protein